MKDQDKSLKSTGTRWWWLLKEEVLNASCLRDVFGYQQMTKQRWATKMGAYHDQRKERILHQFPLVGHYGGVWYTSLREIARSVGLNTAILRRHYLVSCSLRFWFPVTRKNVYNVLECQWSAGLLQKCRHAYDFPSNSKELQLCLNGENDWS